MNVWKDGTNTKTTRTEEIDPNSKHMHELASSEQIATNNPMNGSIDIATHNELSSMDTKNPGNGLA